MLKDHSEPPLLPGECYLLGMELAQALQDAFYILEEERVRPTLNYRYVATEWAGGPGF